MSAPTRRRWIKLYPIECLDGSIRYQLEPDERGAWYDLLNFAAVCSNTGVIADRSCRAFPHSFIANRLNISGELLERTLKKCIEEGRLTEDGAGIQIVNWAIYQSEYDRQKPFRELKSSTSDLIEELAAKLGHRPTLKEFEAVLKDRFSAPETQRILNIARKQLDDPDKYKRGKYGHLVQG